LRKERVMAEKKKVVCPWCGKESTPTVQRERSDYAAIVVRTCALCGKIIASYLEEEQGVLEKVRTF
jgi:transcription elongation factor Elf1